MASLIVVIAQLTVLTLVSRMVYLCYFHPLAPYPGPFWARFTNLWYVFIQSYPLHITEIVELTSCE